MAGGALSISKDVNSKRKGERLFQRFSLCWLGALKRRLRSRTQSCGYDVATTEGEGSEFL